jgi:ectoine hydroxylase-related dioxygenase (phytanoyl-CoA dioxygenase family)
LTGIHPGDIGIEKSQDKMRCCRSSSSNATTASHRKTMGLRSLPILLLFCFSSCRNFHFIALLQFGAVPGGLISSARAFVYNPVASVASSRTQHGLEAKKRNKKHTAEAKNPSPSIDINNLLSNMGLQQVNNTGAAATTKNNKKANTTTNDSTTNFSFPDISLQTQLDYARNGHAVLRNFITDDDDDKNSLASSNKLINLRMILQDLASEEELKAWKQKVEVAVGTNKDDVINTCHSVEDCQKTLQDLGIAANKLPFLQYFNTWLKIPEVRDLAFALGETASTLLDVPTVRLYQDAIFWKRVKDGPTPWHVDAKMAPFDTSNMITFWIPLDKIPHPKDGGTALIFCSKSHVDFALPYWNPAPEVNNVNNNNNNNNNIIMKDTTTSEWDRLDERYPSKDVDYMPMNLGDVTVHSGWTLHCSNGNDRKGSHNDRIAIAITFVDGNAEIRPQGQKGDDEDRWSYESWFKEIIPRRKFSHELVPIVWPPSLRESDDAKNNNMVKDL